MAEEQVKDRQARDRQARDRQDNGRQDGGARPSGSRKLGAIDALHTARQRVQELTGKDPETVTLIEPADRGGWRVGLAVLELRRIPSTADLLATYELDLDADGELIGYRRVRRYARSEQGEDAPTS